jgi:hypothetical protein
LLVRDTNGAVYGLTYKWRSDHSEADLLEGAFTEELTIKTTTPVGSFGSSRHRELAIGLNDVRCE